MRYAVNRFFAASEKGAAILLAVSTMAVLAGALTLGMVGGASLKSDQDKILVTREKMEKVIDHIAAFAQRHSRLPCAASVAVDPLNITQYSQNFGFENRNGANFNCNANGFRGIVPFRSLGLQERDVTDAWGRLLTYHVSEVFTNLDAVLANAPTPDNVFPSCRIDTVWVSNERRFDLADTLITTVANRNPMKALFCCPPIGNSGVANAANDLVMTTETAAIIPPRAGFNGRDDTGFGGVYGSMDTALPLNGGAAGTVAAGTNHGNPVTWAVALVSHGSNGLGAWAMNNNQIPGAQGSELENADGDPTLIDAPISRAGAATYFDDILVYRNNWQLMAELNNATCARPFR